MSDTQVLEEPEGTVWRDIHSEFVASESHGSRIAPISQLCSAWLLSLVCLFQDASNILTSHPATIAASAGARTQNMHRALKGRRSPAAHYQTPCSFVMRRNSCTRSKSWKTPCEHVPKRPGWNDCSS
eukprot:4269260-Amphidinium_carterae.1